MKKRIFKGLLLFLCGFLLFFGFRLIYGYSVNDASNASNGNFYSNDDGTSARKNYASYKMEMKDRPTAASSPVSIDQKFEKIASLKIRTSLFTEDEKAVRADIKKYNGLIQYEQNSGNIGTRAIHLSIGVPASNFDAMVNDMKKIGRVTSIQVTKLDKTNEYKSLNAKKISYEKLRDALQELKKQTGRIDEYISLQNRILQTDSVLQDLGVQLGDFDTENEFCTVKISLTEGQSIAGISLFQRIKVSLEWAFQYYLLFITILLFASLASLIAIIIFDKLKISEMLKRGIDKK